MRHTNYKATKKRGRQRIRPTKYRDFIINYTPDDIAHAKAMLTAAQIPRLSDMPKGTPDPHAGEARLAAQLDEIDVLVERYRHAMEYMAWFQPAWDTLTEIERDILMEFYMGDKMRNGAVLRLAERLCYGTAQIDRMRRKALNRLTVMLFGK